jgi:suppressor of ftsI
MSAHVRRAAVLGAVAALAAACLPASASAATSAADCHTKAPPLIRDGFPQPQLRYSRNGRLDTTLRAAVGPVKIGDQTVTTMAYEGTFPGPILVVCAGDRMVVHLQNDLPQVTNLHTHGFHVMPGANHDNVYLDIKPGERFTYEYQIPTNNPPGMYWYHPHRHMFVDEQIFAGMAGAIVEEGGLDTVLALRKVPQRWMVIQNTEIQDGRTVPQTQSSPPLTPLYVNGVINPVARIKPGELQRWRILNANADRIVVLELPKGQLFQILAEDGNTFRHMRTDRQLFLAPGSRLEVLVRGPKAGSYPLRARPFVQRPGATPPQLNQHVVTLRSQGGKVKRPAPLPRGTLSNPVDLRKQKVERKRRVVFGSRTNPTGPPDFLLNGEMFDPDRVITMKLNSLEEWTLVNATKEWHTFHIHINDFQVVSVGGKNRSFVDYRDNVAIPPNSNVVIRQRPTDFTGKFVFHCHVVFHEDHGMMAAVQVLKHPTAEQLAPSVRQEHGMTVASAAYGATEDAALPTATQFALWCDLTGRRHDALGLAPEHAAV